MAIGPAEKGRRNLICTNSRGSLAVVDSQLQLLDNVMIRGGSCSGSSPPKRRTARCASAAWRSRPGNLIQTVAVGVNLKGRELWSYPLPQGFLPQPVEPIIAGKLTSGAAGQWLLPADGSIHILDADGTLLDRFNYGAALCGLATAEIDGKPALIVATAGTVEGLAGGVRKEGFRDLGI